MNNNYKGNFKDIDPILYEGGAHFKYKDLYNKLLQIESNFININQEIENDKIDDKSKIKKKHSITSKNLFNKKLFLKKNKTNLIHENTKRYSNDNNELILPKIVTTNQSYQEKDIVFYKKKSEELNMTTRNKIMMTLKKKENINYEHFFSNLNSNNEDNNIIFRYKNKNTERIPQLSNFIQKDLINDYLNMKKKKLNDKIKFNFMQNKIQKS
jgi:hypothetical protein